MIVGLACVASLATPSNAATTEAGQKGARIYCFMRNNGNEHEVSWTAAYALIKRQGNGLFKTSPKHGAVMIIEAVVQNPNDYKDRNQKYCQPKSLIIKIGKIKLRHSYCSFFIYATCHKIYLTTFMKIILVFCGYTTPPLHLHGIHEE